MLSSCGSRLRRDPGQQQQHSNNTATTAAAGSALEQWSPRHTLSELQMLGLSFLASLVLMLLLSLMLLLLVLLLLLLLLSA
jgi:hypothetical protein